jgi:phenylacetate-coenzyme A ligase PaaK-like adenylate-forming protein
MAGPKKDITSQDYMSKQEIFDLQDRKFMEVISHIADVPFYRKKLRARG